MAQTPEQMDPREIIQEKPQNLLKLMIGLLFLTGIILGGFCGLKEWNADDGFVSSVPTFEQVTVERGTIATTLTTSGTAAARKSAGLSFSTGGIVVAVEASLGDQVAEGQVLARLDDRNAQNGLRISKDNLMEAELRLWKLLTPPSAADLLNSEKAITAARSQLALAKLNLEAALEPPTAAEIAAADAAIAQAQSSLDTLMTPPTWAEMATADATVQQNQVAAISADREVQPAYANLRVSQRSFCSLNLIQPSILIADAESLWQTADASQISLTLDKTVIAHGASSLKIGLPRYQVGKTVIAKKTFSALDLSEFDHIEFWVRSDTSMETGYFQLTIYDSEWLDASLEALEIPELEEGLWTHVSIPISKLSSDNAVQTLGIRFSPDMLMASPNQTLWLDEVQAVAQNPICESDSLPLSADSVEFLISKVDEATSGDGTVATKSRDFIQSNSNYVKALDNRNVATANLLSATAKRDALDNGPLNHEITKARTSLESATKKRGEMDDQLSPSKIAQLQAAIENSEAALDSAEANKEDLISGPSENDIQLQELDIARANQAVQQAEETLTDTELKAPFSGQIGEVNVSEGSHVAVSTTVFLLVALDSVRVDLTVSESDFIGLASGDLGMATFDSIPDQPFFIRLTNITALPQITQGVVTYPAQAEFLNVRQVAEILPRFGSLLQGANGSLVTGSTGVTLPDIDLQALRLCAAKQVGRNVSDPRDLTPRETEQIRENCLPGIATGEGRRSGLDDSNRTHVKPAVGMNANVTILLEIKEDILIVPAQAIRSENGRKVVTVIDQNQTAVPVITGITNMGQTEIVSGLEEGQVVLVPSASNASVPAYDPTDGSTVRPGQRGAPR